MIAETGTGLSPRGEPGDYREALRAGAAQAGRGARTRAAILSAACTLLARSAPADLTVAAICTEAGIAHGTFYIHFPDRQALTDALLEGFVGYLQEALHHASRAAAGQDAVRATTAAYVALFAANPGLMRCLVHHLDAFPGAQAAFQRLNAEWIATVVRAAETRAAAASGAAPPHAELTRRAYALGGMVDQYLAAWLLSRDPGIVAVSQDREAVIGTLSLIWDRGMSP